MEEWIIETARLGLRRLQRDDLGQIRRMAWLDADRVLHRSLQAYERAGYGYLAVILRDGGEFAGVCGLLDQEIEGCREAEVGYHLIEAFHGRGIATEAARGVMDYAAQTLGLRRIVSFIEHDNDRSARVAAKNGLIYERDALFRDIPVRIFAADPSAGRIRGGGSEGAESSADGRMAARPVA